MIGLTGGIASGKSTVTNRLRELGAFVADADAVSREAIDLPEAKARILDKFGADVFLEDGSVSRPALAEKAFSSPEATALLNSILHPVIAARLIELTNDASREYPLVFTDAALLIESGFDRLCEGVWLVTANTETRIQRIMERDGLTREQAQLRIARQMPDEEKRAYASVVIENDGTLEDLIKRVDAAYRNELFGTSELEEIRDAYED
ncbi:MAG: dephospho-CoA kinase [Clostridia bacterium]|nr:dephospho-CoA kinase [Clostridia bacterium]MBQ4167017.1 dephospho-CoA kinase [Clostridia bacterium]